MFTIYLYGYVYGLVNCVRYIEEGVEFTRGLEMSELGL